MTTEKLYIKNMVCDRCIKAVHQALSDLGLTINNIELGFVEFTKGKKDIDRSKIRVQLHKHGFELIDDRKSKIIHKIKTLAINLVHYDHSAKAEHVNFSEYLEKEIGRDYTYLSSLFSSVEGRTIEKYIIAQKIERVKELIIYDELTLSEIAWKLGYSSVQYLSNQFKKETGLTFTQFKKIKENKRKAIDHV